MFVFSPFYRHIGISLLISLVDKCPRECPVSIMILPIIIFDNLVNNKQTQYNFKNVISQFLLHATYRT